MTWRETGTFVIKDEFGRLHYRGCDCTRASGEKGPHKPERRFCTTDTPGLGWIEESAAAMWATALEASNGYSCAVYPMQVQ